MDKIRTKLRAITTLGANEEGLTTVEYAIVLCLIALVAFGAWSALGSSVSSAANSAAEKIKGIGK